MKRKMLNLLLLAALFLSACARPAKVNLAVGAQSQSRQPNENTNADTNSSNQQATPVIKVGVLYPLTGPDAGWAGEPYIKSHQMAIDEINAAGGIACLDGAKLELVKGDTKGEVETGNAEMDRLTSTEGVIAVMGSALSETTIPASEIAERNQVPYIVPNALDGVITDRNLNYVFQTVSTLQQWASDDAQWAKEHGVRTAVVTTPDSSFGKEVSEAWQMGLGAAGILLPDSFTYEGETHDFTDTIARLKAVDPDAWFLLGNSQPPELIKQLKEQGYYPRMGIITLGSGFATSYFLNEAGTELADGIIVTSDFSPYSSLNVSEDFKKKFAEDTGQELGGTYNTTYASTWLLADALEKACSTDPKKLAEVLHHETFTDGKWNFQWPEVSFDEKGRLKQAASVIAQWQDGRQVAVWPENLAAGKTVWPVRGWDQRSEGIGAAAPAAAEAPSTDENPALASDYSQALLNDSRTVVDTSGFQKSGPYTIAVSQQDASNGWGKTYNVTIDAYGQELLKKGKLARPLLNSVTNDVTQQISDIERFIQQKPDAIVVEPLGRVASAPVIKRAVEAGIPVVLCGNGIEGPDFTTRVDVDFYEVAYKSGEGLARLLGGKGTVVFFNGIAGVDSTETWRTAALDALSQYPEIEVIAETYAQWNVATAQRKMEAMLSVDLPVDGVWAGGGEMALGAALAYEAAGLPAPKFSMVNVPNGFLRLAQEYQYQFVASPDPPSMSKYCLQTAVDILEGKEITKFISLRTLMEGADPYDFSSFDMWYVPELNDSFIPPATVDIQFYLDGGFEGQ